MLYGGMKPKLIILISGKRKSGKDYVAELIHQRLPTNSSKIIRLSEPLKSEYARLHSLDTARLMDSTAYKETYRADMVKWGEEKRAEDAGYFCRAAASSSQIEQPVWIVSDCRRRTDMAYFDMEYPPSILRKVRIEASPSTRSERGWTFTPGIDDQATECDLDAAEFEWDYVIQNDDSNDSVLMDQIDGFVSDVVADGFLV